MRAAAVVAVLDALDVVVWTCRSGAAGRSTRDRTVAALAELGLVMVVDERPGRLVVGGDRRVRCLTPEQSVVSTSAASRGRSTVPTRPRSLRPSICGCRHRMMRAAARRVARHARSEG
jgi:hypothetical protein